MPKPEPPRLDQILGLYAPQGANDAKWFLVEHQLEQLKISAQTLVEYLTNVYERPENKGEAQLAEDCLDIAKAMRLDIYKHRAAFRSYLSDTNVPDRIARKEL